MELFKLFDEDGNMQIPEDDEEEDDYYYIISKIFEDEEETDTQKYARTRRKMLEYTLKGGLKMDLWKHQRVEECKAKVETGGGPVNVIQEDGTDIESMAARMQAKGILGAALLHSTANTRRTSEAQAITMLKNAKKCPQYMDLSESNRILKRVQEQSEQLQAIKDERSKYDGNN